MASLLTPLLIVLLLASCILIYYILASQLYTGICCITYIADISCPDIHRDNVVVGARIGVKNKPVLETRNKTLKRMNETISKLRKKGKKIWKKETKP